MARLSRVESQERTRERLVATARQLFLSHGYAATSLSDVAETAGYSKGAVYSNFRGKGHLCLAALDDIRAEQLALLTAAVMGEAGIDERLAAFAGWAEAHIGDEAWTTLEVEFLTSARHDAELRREITGRVGVIREALAQLIDALAQELGVTAAMPADRAAMTLLSLGIGLGVQRVADPTVPTAVLTETLRLVLRMDEPDTAG
ncbi:MULTISPECIES: TetR/AcrR family transcriptional regulator [Streptomyces]|uniref:AcrR family transcriptional regulator n=1 Tax=Streptomyces stelliscabiei TaxID=146820 RepID=A0A8I0TUY1_9ACTN|nr:MULTISPECIES: TetR family transcriptional regulator [Streptomyces]KND41912.1 TetR family transcriptional regulator [Streptomyces stelliscabiei]MBE1598778.1 AcrR family transcriptional regulator [Streptomyces stelliscabiei]MDX2516433.1 TetR family transcriptional regulator [Streptomyces stelliscabiei]MDX2553683.1 TetR family transcriptional regulator [Streptomyces stelliscabiei]MDX2613341.1 TetR family transcriptional regulator [Streptomyces stelliscabiei]